MSPASRQCNIIIMRFKDYITLFFLKHTHPSLRLICMILNCSLPSLDRPFNWITFSTAFYSLTISFKRTHTTIIADKCYLIVIKYPAS